MKVVLDKIDSVFEIERFETYHIDGQVVRQIKKHFRSAVKARLDVVVKLLAHLTGGAEIDNFNDALFGVAEENVLGLEVAVNDLQFACREKHQRGQQLLAKLPRQVQGDPAKIALAQEVVEVVGEKLKYQAQMIAPHEIALHRH